MDHQKPIDLNLRGMSEDDLWSVSPENALRIENLERNPDGYWRVMPGVLQVGDQWDGYGGVIGLCFFQPRPAQRFLVVETIVDETTSELGWVTWPFGAVVPITTRKRVPGRPAASQFLQHGRWLYHINGIEGPVRWDGERVEPVGFTGATPAPMAMGQSEGFSYGDAAGADLTAMPPDYTNTWQKGLGERPDGTPTTSRWTYAYALVAVNALGMESPASAPVYASGENDVASGAAGLRMARLVVPVMPEWVVAVKVLRSVNLYGIGAGANPELFELEAFTYSGGFEYVDHHPDDELGIAYDPNAHGEVPMGVRCAAFHHEAMWVMVDNRLYRSLPGYVEVFPPANFYTVGGTGAYGVWLHSIPAGLVIGTTRGVFLAKGNPVDGYRIETLSEKWECVAPRATAYIEGLGLVFLTTAGPAVLRGILEPDASTAVVALKGIRRTWRTLIGQATLHNALVLHRPEVEEVWFHVPLLGETKPTLGLVFHYGDGGTWSLRPSWKFTSCTTYGGRTWLGSSDTTSTATTGVFLLTRAGMGAAQNAEDSPPDPNTPEFRLDIDTSAIYTETTPDGYAFRNISGQDVVGVYETGVVTTSNRTVVQSLEMRALLTGRTDALDVQVRHGRSSLFVQTDDEDFRGDALPEDPDDELSAQFRPRWDVSAYDTDGVWTDYEPGFVPVRLVPRLARDVQFRFRGLDFRLSGARLNLDRPSGDPPLLSEP